MPGLWAFWLEPVLCPEPVGVLLPHTEGGSSGKRVMLLLLQLLPGRDIDSTFGVEGAAVDAVAFVLVMGRVRGRLVTSCAPAVASELV